jgi:hypothetical protein
MIEMLSGSSRAIAHMRWQVITHTKQVVGFYRPIGAHLR